jgi:2-dehydropantoate 2-reductase
MASTRIAIVGTGANGAAIGADLVRAGHDVTFIEQWPEHVEAMKARGLRVEMPTGATTTELRRVLHLCQVATLRSPFDVVLLGVKAYDTRWACELIKPFVASDGVVVGVQNGMTHDDVASIVGRARSLACVIEIAANMFEPGVVERQTPPPGTWFAIGSPDRTAAHAEDTVAELLGAAGTVEVRDDILSAKWMKLVGNAAEFLPSAIVDLPMVEALRTPGIREVADIAGREALETGIELGHRIVPLFGVSGLEAHGPDTYAAAVLDAILEGWSLPDTRVALLQDWMKGRRGEGEDINGRVVAERRRLGGRAPVNEVLVDLARRIESGQLERGVANTELMIDLARRAVAAQSVEA